MFVVARTKMTKTPTVMTALTTRLAAAQDWPTASTALTASTASTTMSACEMGMPAMTAMTTMTAMMAMMMAALLACATVMVAMPMPGQTWAGA